MAALRLKTRALFGLAGAILSGCATPSRGEFTSRWTAADEVAHVALPSGFTLRYVQRGEGPVIVLMHTLRTQLDYFEAVVPALATNHRVIAVDLPGHGQSTILEADYAEPLFRKVMSEFIVALDLHQVTLVGESIGGVLALSVTGEVPERIARVVSLNPYDYGEKFGGGIRRGSASWIIGVFGAVGGLETRGLLRRVLQSGFHDRAKLSDEALDEIYRTGLREGYRTMEYSLFDHWQSWVDAKAVYSRVTAPVTLVYSRYDWSNAEDRAATRLLLPAARVVVIDDAGHFVSLEQPDAVAREILESMELATR
jgi:pimeloyl-ACP methyl ester carboxylesterase